MTEKLLDGADVVAIFKEMGSEGVAEGVARRALRDAASQDRPADGLLDRARMEVMAYFVAVLLADAPARRSINHLMYDGAGVGTVHTLELENTSLVDDFTWLADLRVPPLALAQLLAAVPAAVLERAGAILQGELQRLR